jgi:DNA-binding LacI/PurR family transcriptional regulator
VSEPRSARLADIAARADVSEATVSRSSTTARRSMGLEVPRDVSVVGYDDSTMTAFTDPPLSTIRRSVEGMRDAAVRAPLDEIGGAGPPTAEYVFRPGIVVRGSTGAVPCRLSHLWRVGGCAPIVET